MNELHYGQYALERAQAAVARGETVGRADVGAALAAGLITEDQVDRGQLTLAAQT